MYVGAFAIQGTKAKNSNWVLNTNFEQILLRLIDFYLTGLLEDFLSVP